MLKKKKKEQATLNAPKEQKNVSDNESTKQKKTFTTTKLLMSNIQETMEDDDLSPESSRIQQYGYRGYACLFIVVCLFAVLGLRLFSLQIINADTYATLADNNKIRIISQPAKRGNIYDANMEELANSKPVFAVAIASAEIEDKQQVAQALATVLNDPEITAESIVTKINNNTRKYEPIIIKRYTYDDALVVISRLEELRDVMPGVLIIEEPMRYYPQQTLAGHVLGTVGLLSEQEEKLIEEYNYGANDWLGKTGLEKEMERFTVNNKEIGLRGKKGIQSVEVNSKYRAVKTRSTQDPVAGNSMVLNLQANVQKVMEDSLKNTIQLISKSRPKCKAGAAVLLDVKTGGVIAMASYPEVNPNDFANGLAPEKQDYYWKNPDSPLINRAISGVYPPGSTFKMATAVSGLYAGTIDPKTKVNCTYSNWTPPRAKCTKAHGWVDFKTALAVSCNTYFQEIGYLTGIDKIYEACNKLGFGKKTGIDLPSEVSGLLPNAQWKAEKFAKDSWENQWRPYDTYYMSMGQGYGSYTTLQLADYVAAIANNGTRMTPKVVKEILSPEGDVLYTFEPQIADVLEMDDASWQVIRDGMRAVTAPGGTAHALFAKMPIEVAAKTGTAQTGLVGDNKNTDYHGLFVAFAPYDDPQVAFACIIEYGYHGGSSGGLVAKSVFEEYFGLIADPILDELPDSME